MSHSIDPAVSPCCNVPASGIVHTIVCEISPGQDAPAGVFEYDGNANQDTLTPLVNADGEGGAEMAVCGECGAQYRANVHP